jgi:hypothetical protein
MLTWEPISRNPRARRGRGGQHAQVPYAAGPVPVARGGSNLAVLVNRESRRRDLLNAAFAEVIGRGCPQELLQAGMIQVQLTHGQ